MVCLGWAGGGEAQSSPDTPRDRLTNLPEGLKSHQATYCKHLGVETKKQTLLSRGHFSGYFLESWILLVWGAEGTLSFKIYCI